MISVEHLNKTFPRYPRTVEDKGWIYGMWYCGTSWKKAELYGQYPATFYKRALALFPDADRILHCPSGALHHQPRLGSYYEVMVDCISSQGRHPSVCANAAALPFAASSFDLCLSDPPYSKADGEKYGTGIFPMKAFMQEARRILKPSGFLAVLHTSYPSYSRKEWKLVGLIGVVTGFLRATRVLSIFQKLDVQV